MDGERDSERDVLLVRFGFHEMAWEIVILAICHEV